MSRGARVGVVSLQHESNTFSPTGTSLDDFEVAVGEEIADGVGRSHSEVAGFLAGLSDQGLEAVPVFAAGATPSGKIDAAALEALLSEMFDAVDRCGPVDGVVVAPHGAAVSEDVSDVDGHWLSLLRRAIGPETPMISTLDLHANLSPAMIEPCDATIAYRTNPHLDTFERGLEAATLMGRALRGEVRPVQAAAFPPMAVNILDQDTRVAPCRMLFERAEEIRGRDGILSASVCLGFPYADVAEMGTSFIVVTDRDEALAERHVDELASFLIEHRHDFDPPFIPAEDAVEQAARLPGPVCLLDTGDNVGGGSAADGTVIAHVVARRGGPRTFVCIYDPDCVRRASDAGIGARLALELGGKVDDLHGPPLEIDVTVKGRHDGSFTESEVRHGGRTRFDMGDTVIVESDAGLTLQLTSKRIVPFSLEQLLCCGIDPRAFHILVAKGVHAPAAAYEPVCTELIRVTTPGSTTPDLSQLAFVHRRRPLYPFEEPSE